MPEGNKPETWRRKLRAPGLSSNAEPFQVALNLGVLFGLAKEKRKRIDANRGMSLP
jgi:hypothetical protein